MCYFIGIRSNIVVENHIFIEGTYVLIADVTKHQKQKEDDKYYYILTLGGCSCKMLHSKDNVLNQNIRSFLSGFPGNQQTELMLHLEGEDNYEAGNNYEKIRPLMKQHIMAKEDFLQLYPSIEQNSLYILT